MYRFAPLASLALILVVAAPTVAQRSTATRTTTTTLATRSTPDADAATALRAGESAATAARSLVEAHRLDSAGVARTLIRAAYDPVEVGLALSTEMQVPPERAWADLAAAGTTDQLIFSAMLQIVRERSEALAILRDRLASGKVLAIIQRSDALEATEEEIAADMAAAGYTLEEIIEILSSPPHSMSADEILTLFLELNIASPDDAEMYGWLRENGLSARDAVAAMGEDVSAASRAEVLRAGGYAWDAIVDALKWTGETVEEAAQAALAAGAPLGDMIQWLVDEGETAAEIFDLVVDSKNDLITVAIEMLNAGHSAQEVAFGLHGAGASLEDIVQFLADQGLSPEEIAAILQALEVNVTTMVYLMTTIMEMQHDAAMAIISNL